MFGCHVNTVNKLRNFEGGMIVIIISKTTTEAESLDGMETFQAMGFKIVLFLKHSLEPLFWGRKVGSTESKHVSYNLGETSRILHTCHNSSRVALYCYYQQPETTPPVTSNRKTCLPTIWHKLLILVQNTRIEMRRIFFPSQNEKISKFEVVHQTWNEKGLFGNLRLPITDFSRITLGKVTRPPARRRYIQSVSFITHWS